MFFEGNLDNLRSVLAPSLPEEKFVAFIGYGCVIGAWLSAGFLVLDWDRPWQAWPIPCIIGAVLGTFTGWVIFNGIYIYVHNMSSNSLNELIHNLLIFILEYNWIYNFQWIGDLCKINKDSSNLCISSIIESLPTSWKNVLKSASLQELQMFVLGTSNLSHWPNSLINLSNQCRQFTRLLFQYMIFKSNKQFPCCYFNSNNGNSSIPLKIVDIGSGLGYLSNYIGYHLILKYGDLFTEPQIIAVECDEGLHLKALTNLSQYNSIFQVKSLTSVVKRLLFRVESTNLDLLQTRLYQFTSGYNYLLLGLHCCGDLSQSMIELFHQDCSAKILLLFPTSDYLRKAMLNCDMNFIEKCITPATLRLACQHSPLTWLNWTELDANKHRIRVLARIILDLILIKYNNLSMVFERYKRLDLVTQCDAIKKLLATNYHENDANDNPRSLHFNDVYPHIINFWQKYLADILCSNQSTNSDLCFTEYRDYFEQIWNLIPGLLALQQLFQPLLETIVLFDRLWYLREYGNINGKYDQDDPYQYSGYIRIFDPVLSPRCMALLVCKK
uniref:Glycosylphosphatidylinositol anchor biosynthesis protein 11 n=1 Tax=Schistosoma haematobium TaxID=6185 RepID=A0A094ZJU8_SCHHA